MIKKIIIIMLLCAICISPVVLAKNNPSSPDDIRLSFTCSVDMEQAQIGEEFLFSIAITNHTQKDIYLFYFSRVFNGSRTTNSASGYVRNITVPANKTITLDISHFVSHTFDWYQKNGSYYVDFSPELHYMATLNPQSDGNEIEGEYLEYYRESENAIPIKITNLKDGAKYGKISVIDDKSQIVFTDSANKDNASYDGELYAHHTSYLEIENISNKEFSPIYIYDEFNPIETIMNKNGQSYEFEQKTHYLIKEQDIKDTINNYYKAILYIDGKYYGIYTSKSYETQVLDVPIADVRELKTYDDLKINMCSYQIENNTSQTIENLVVYFGELHLFSIDTKEQFEKSIITGDLHPGDIWDIPLNMMEYQDVNIAIGYIIEDVFYYRIFIKRNGIYQTAATAINLYPIDGQARVLSMYRILNDIVVTYPTPTITPAPTIDSTPFVVAISASPAPPPIATPTPAPTPQAKPPVNNTPDIPIWVWAALVVAFVVGTLSIGTVLMSKKDGKKKDKNDD